MPGIVSIRNKVTRSFDKISGRLSKHVGLVYIDLDGNGQASYMFKGICHNFSASDMTERALREKVKQEVTCSLFNSRCIVTLLNRTSYSGWMDRAVPIGLGLVLALFGAAYVFFSVNTPDDEETDKFLLDALAATSFVLAGSTMARGFARSKYWNPSSRSVLIKFMPKFLFIASLGLLLGVGGNEWTDAAAELHETFESRGLSKFLPEVWQWIAVSLALGGGIGASWHHLRTRARSHRLKTALRLSSLNVQYW